LLYEIIYEISKVDIVKEQVCYFLLNVPSYNIVLNGRKPSKSKILVNQAFKYPINNKNIKQPYH